MIPDSHTILAEVSGSIHLGLSALLGFTGLALAALIGGIAMITRK